VRGRPGAGASLQGIKKGVLELADGLVVNKADGDQSAAAERARAAHAEALGLLRPASAHWRPRVLTASAHTGQGIEAVWSMVQEHRAALQATGELETRRRQQARAWTGTLLAEGR